MTVTDIVADKEDLTLTVTAHFEAPIETVWQLWADPKLLERWWGPPTFPATVTRHEFRPGGEVRYFMTGPEGDRHGGWWTFTAIEPPLRLAFQDGFLDGDGNRSADMPSIDIAVEIAEEGDKVRMTTQSVFPSIAAMEELIAMGMEEGIRGSMAQIDDLLASLPTRS